MVLVQVLNSLVLVLNSSVLVVRLRSCSYHHSYVKPQKLKIHCKHIPSKSRLHHVQRVHLTFHRPAFRTDPATHSIRRDGWKNVLHITAALCRQPTSGCATSVWSNSTPVESSVFRTGSRTLIRITAANTMPGIPPMIHAHRQPCQSNTQPLYYQPIYYQGGHCFRGKIKDFQAH